MYQCVYMCVNILCFCIYNIYLYVSTLKNEREIWILLSAQQKHWLSSVTGLTWHKKDCRRWLLEQR